MNRTKSTLAAIAIAGAKDASMDNNTPVRVQPTESALRHEIWECRACGTHAPCRVDITYTPTPHAHVEAKSRFVRRVCICAEPKCTDWNKVVPNKPD